MYQRFVFKISPEEHCKLLDGRTCGELRGRSHCFRENGGRGVSRRKQSKEGGEYKTGLQLNANEGGGGVICVLQSLWGFEGGHVNFIMKKP